MELIRDLTHKPLGSFSLDAYARAMFSVGTHAWLKDGKTHAEVADLLEEVAAKFRNDTVRYILLDPPGKLPN